MTEITWGRFPLFAGHEHARRRLQSTPDIGRAPNTITAYGRAFEDHLRFLRCGRHRPAGDQGLVRRVEKAPWIPKEWDRQHAAYLVERRLLVGAGPGGC
ncbi:hypothetical protein ACQPYK_28925 [Streptosporangium sp. CA-135522]|uniref:hypothetical protein n=1 Tax=Streptosporangium sp. CA-135522 TaxID=3240072 RepID=UPI003D92C256